MVLDVVWAFFNVAAVGVKRWSRMVTVHRRSVQLASYEQLKKGKKGIYKNSPRARDASASRASLCSSATVLVLMLDAEPSRM
jgi:hypothetical protein